MCPNWTTTCSEQMTSFTSHQNNKGFHFSLMRFSRSHSANGVVVVVVVESGGSAGKLSRWHLMFSPSPEFCCHSYHKISCRKQWDYCLALTGTFPFGFRAATECGCGWQVLNTFYPNNGEKFLRTTGFLPRAIQQQQQWVFRRFAKDRETTIIKGWKRL